MGEAAAAPACINGVVFVGKPDGMLGGIDNNKGGIRDNNCELD